MKKNDIDDSESDTENFAANRGISFFLGLLVSVTVLFIFTACERNDLYDFAKTTKKKTLSYYVVGLNGAIFKTSDITSGSWSDLTSTVLPYRGIVTVSSKLVVVGGSYPPANSGFIKSSSDGLNWTDQIVAGTAYSLSGIKSGGSLFIAYGDDSGAKQVWYSADGFNWVQAGTIPNGTYNTNYNLKASAYGNGYYVIVGGFSSNGEIIRSTDGANWTVTSPSCAYLNGVAFSPANNRFVVVGRTGAVLYSDDYGGTWTNAGPVGAIDHSCIAFGNGKFVATGASGQVYSSIDGAAWILQTSGTTESLVNVIFLEGRFIITGTNGTVLWSDDAVVWKNVSPGGSNSLYSITAVEVN